MFSHLTELDFLKIASGSGILLGAGVVINLIAKKLSLSLKWFRPGTWIVIAFQVWAAAWTSFYRGLDAFVVEWRASKKELLQEPLQCENDME